MEKTASEVGADYAHILAAHRGAADFLLRAEAKLSDAETPTLRSEFSDHDLPLAAQCVRLGIPVFVADAEADSSTSRRGLIEGKPYRCGMAVPVWGDRAPLGVVAVYSTRPGRFITDQLAALTETTRLAADAFRSENASRALQREAEIRGILLEISRLASASLSREDFAQALADRLRSLIPLDRLVIAMFDGTGWRLRITHVAGARIPEWFPGKTAAIGDTVYREILRSDRGLRFDHRKLREIARSIPVVDDALRANLNSLLAAPLRVRGKTVGSIGLFSRQNDAFSDEHLQFLERIAQEISGPVVNAGLYDQLQHRADISAIIAEIGRAASSRVEPGELMAREFEHIRQVVPFDRVGLESVDMASRTMTRLFAAGTEVPNSSVGDQRPLMPMTEKAIFRGEPVIRVEGESYADDGPTPFHDPGAVAGLNSILSVPLIAGGMPVGALAFRSRDRDAYGPREAELAMRIAHLIAGHMDHARLRREVEEQRRSCDLLGRLRRQIDLSTSAGGMLDAACSVLASGSPVDHVTICLESAELCECDSTTRHQHNASSGSLPSGCALPDALGSAEPQPLSPASGSLSEDPSSASGVDDGFVVPDQAGHAWLIFPVYLGSRRLGVLGFHAPDRLASLYRHTWFIHEIARSMLQAFRERAAVRHADDAHRLLDATRSTLDVTTRRIAARSLASGLVRALEERIPLQCFILYQESSDASRERTVLFQACRHEAPEDHDGRLLQEGENLTSKTLASATSGVPLDETWSSWWRSFQPDESAHDADFSRIDGAIRVTLSESDRITAYFVSPTSTLERATREELAGLAVAWMRPLYAAWQREQADPARPYAPAVLSTKVRSDGPVDDPDALRSLLNDKEFVILLKLTQGLNNEQIGAALGLSAGTIKNHLGGIYRRLGVTSRTAAIAVAINAGLFASGTI